MLFIIYSCRIPNQLAKVRRGKLFSCGYHMFYFLHRMRTKSSFCFDWHSPGENKKPGKWVPCHRITDQHGCPYWFSKEWCHSEGGRKESSQTGHIYLHFPHSISLMIARVVIYQGINLIISFPIHMHKFYFLEKYMNF